MGRAVASPYGSSSTSTRFGRGSSLGAAWVMASSARRRAASAEATRSFAARTSGCSSVKLADLSARSFRAPMSSVMAWARAWSSTGSTAGARASAKAGAPGDDAGRRATRVAALERCRFSSSSSWLLMARASVPMAFLVSANSGCAWRNSDISRSTRSSSCSARAFSASRNSVVPLFSSWRRRAFSATRRSAMRVQTFWACSRSKPSKAMAKVSSERDLNSVFLRI